MDGTVLVIDADLHARTVAETLLRLRDVRVRSAPTAGDASTIVRRENVAVLVLDVSSPGTHGFEVLRELRGRFSQLRIIVIADWEEAAVEHLARRLGADAFLRKPLSPSVLVRTVEEQLATAASGFGSPAR